MKKRSKDEKNLLLEIKQHKAHYVDQFYLSSIMQARKIACDIINDWQHACELANNAFLATLQSRIIFDSREKAQNYFYTATRNAALNYIASAEYKKRKGATNEFPEISDTTDIETSYAKAQILKEIKKEIEKFPDKYKTILNMYNDNKSTAEIARHINKDDQYVLNTKNRLLNKILKALKLKGLIMLF